MHPVNSQSRGPASGIDNRCRSALQSNGRRSTRLHKANAPGGLNKRSQPGAGEGASRRDNEGPPPKEHTQSSKRHQQHQHQRDASDHASTSTTAAAAAV